jgi:hypothetical protein
MTTITKSLVFHTNGPIDPKSWELMGISAKEIDNPIGLFGTGLKYALAVLLREGHQIDIHSDGKHWSFGVADINFRGKDFQQITCNGQNLPFTTEYGKNWKVAGAYRELVSNTMDEGGIWFTGEAMKDGTSIVVTGSEILKAHKNHDQMFIGDREPLHESRNLKIYTGNGKVFYRGVKVKELEKAHYDYEILCHIDLTEDRTIANEYSLRYRIGEAICREVKDSKLLEYFVTANGFESTLDYDNPWSDELNETVSRLWETRPTDVNKSIAQIFKRKNPTAGFQQQEMVDDEMAMVERAMEFLSLAGYPVNARIKKVKCDNQNIIAYYHDGDIHLTQKAFDKGCFEMVATLFEEQCHANGHDDYSLPFQQYLINELIGQAKRKLKFAL